MDLVKKIMTYTDTLSHLIELDQTTKKHMFKICTTCKCCTRHQINRPKTLKSKVIYVYWHGTQITNDDCQCMCRHVARQINESTRL